MGKTRSADVPALSLSLVDSETRAYRRAHLDGGDAHLAVTLGEVAVADREERAFHGHRYVEPGTAS